MSRCNSRGPSENQLTESGTTTLANLSPAYRIPLKQWSVNDTLVTVARPPSVRSDYAVRDSPDIVVGPENRLVEYAIRELVTETSPRALSFLNPLVFVGPTGCGKSRIASGLAATCNNGHATLFATADEWSREYGLACKQEQLASWKLKQRNVKLFALDDLRFLTKKTAAQRELCLLIDDLTTAGIPMILTCHRHPGTDSEWSPALCSRMAAGLTIPLQDPHLEARFSLINLFAKKHNWQLSKEALAVAASEISGTIAEIQRTLLRCLQQTDHESELTGPKIRSLLRQSRSTSMKAICLEEIANCVGRFLDVPVKSMQSQSRRAVTVQARSIGMHLSRHLTDASLTEIGNFYGGRNHTTVMHACRKIERELISDSVLNDLIQEMKHSLHRSNN